MKNITFQKLYQAHTATIDGQITVPTDYQVEYQNIGDLLTRQAAMHAEETFLTFYNDKGEQTSYTYAEFYTLASKTANFLKSQGILEEDRIATISHNHAETIVQYFAAWLIGATVVPINLGETDDRITYIVQNAKAKLGFVRDEYAERILSLNLDGLKLIRSSEFLNVIGPMPDTYTHSGHIELDLELEALIVYTSGTTGNPKGVVLTHYNLLIDAHSIAKWHGLESGDVMMCVLPIHHVNGTVATMMTPMTYGGKMVLNQKFKTDYFFERLAAEKVKIVSVVPTLLAFLIDANVDLSKHDLSAFRHFICGAGPLTVELCQKFEDKYHLKVIHGYGLSETTCYSCFLPVGLSEDVHRKWLRDYGFPSIGVPMPCNEMDIQDEAGNSMKEGVKGEIVIRGHNVMKYYYDNDEANEKTFANGWFRSGDEGFWMREGIIGSARKYFFITGRLKELIIRGGVNHSPLEIDEVISQHPAVKAGIAVAFENDYYGEEVGAYVQVHDGAAVSAEDIIAFCRAKLSFEKSPKVVVFGSDFPVTTTGKYQRGKVKHLFTEWKAVQFKR